MGKRAHSFQTCSGVFDRDRLVSRRRQQLVRKREWLPVQHVRHDMGIGVEQLAGLPQLL